MKRSVGVQRSSRGCKLFETGYLSSKPAPIGVSALQGQFETLLFQYLYFILCLVILLCVPHFPSIEWA